MNAELVREYIKNWVWEGRTVMITDQLYIIAKQARQEQILLKDVDLIITDSPIRLSNIYETKYSKPPFVTVHMVEKYESEAKRQGFEYVHIFLKRVKKYNPKGRYQTEEEAKAIDLEVKDYLNDNNIKFHEIVADETAAQEIYKLINRI